MIVYAYLYNSCIPESASAVVSLHRTKAGAWRAMRLDKWQKAERLLASDRSYKGARPHDSYRMPYEWFGVRAIEVQED